MPSSEDLLVQRVATCRGRPLEAMANASVTMPILLVSGMSVTLAMTRQAVWMLFPKLWLEF